MTPEEFKQKFWPHAQKASEGTKVFPETIMAAAALESGWARSSLSAQYNNFFGIKAGKGWDGKVINMPTHEEVNGHIITINAPFRHYDSPEESFANYVHFISGPRYITAGVHDAKNPGEQFDALRKAGYATDSQYPIKLRNVLKLLNLGTPASQEVKTEAPGSVTKEFKIIRDGKVAKVVISVSSNDKPKVQFLSNENLIVVSLL